MGDYIGIIILIIYLFAAAFGKKNKAKKQRNKKTGGEQNIDFLQAFKKELESQAPAQEKGADITPDCDRKRMHLHDVTQRQMHLAAEGEDPCHRGGVSDQGPPEMPDHYSYDTQISEQSELAKDVLRGVIMSEILIRPCDRAALRRNGRSK